MPRGKLENTIHTGLQNEDTIFVQEIVRQTIGPDNKLGYHPPQCGDKVVTRKGPFKVFEAETVVVPSRSGKTLYFFRALGQLVN